MDLEIENLELNPAQERIRARLIQCAKADQLLGYKELALEMGLPWNNSDDRNKLFADLWCVSMWEYKHGNPLLSVLVVSKSSDDGFAQFGLPGKGFFDMAERVGKCGASRDDQEAFAYREMNSVYDHWKSTPNS
jgi:hypothetical protein